MKNILIYSIVFVFFYSCGEIESTDSIQTSSGKTAEILVVAPHESDIKGMLGDTVRQYFAQEFPILPQPEGLFDLSFIPKRNFENSDVLKTHHNILVLDIDSTYQRAKLEKMNNVWAGPQILLRLKASSRVAIIEAFENYSEQITEIFMKNEIRRLQRFMKPYLDEDINQYLKEHYHFSLDVPNGFFIAKKTSNFVWLRREKEKTGEGILIYSYPYEDTLAFNPKRVLSFRDSITKMYIPGPSPDSYMEVERRFYPPISKKITLNDKFALVTRGLWRVENDFMGGAFINYAFVDESLGRVVHLDAYVYNPKTSNRDMIIRLMAILQTYKSPQE